MNEKDAKTVSVQNFRIALLLAVAGTIAVLLLMPYLFAVMPQLAAKIPLPLRAFAVVQSLQVGVLLLLLGWTGLRLGYAYGLDAPLLRNRLHAGPRRTVSSRWATSIALGIAVGVVVVLLAHALMLTSSEPTWWKGLLASFYGGIVEEALLRLFMVSLLVWLGARLLRVATPGAGTYWTAIVLAAIIFGVGHLPAQAQTTALTTTAVLRTIGLNALGGIAFGWLFWRRGLEHAMLAHFSADLVLHVAAPAFG